MFYHSPRGYWITTREIQPNLISRFNLQMNRIEKAKRIKNKERRARVINRIDQANNKTVRLMSWESFEEAVQQLVARDKGEIL